MALVESQYFLNHLLQNASAVFAFEQRGWDQTEAVLKRDLPAALVANRQKVFEQL
jgi:hypothetical protein